MQHRAAQMVFWFNLMEFVGVRVGSKDPRSLILELRLSEWLTVQVDSLGGGWKSETARVAIYGISRILITLQLICTKATKKTFCLLVFHFSISWCTWCFLLYMIFFFGIAPQTQKTKSLKKLHYQYWFSQLFKRPNTPTTAPTDYSYHFDNDHLHHPDQETTIYKISIICKKLSGKTICNICQKPYQYSIFGRDHEIAMIWISQLFLALCIRLAHAMIGDFS